MRRNVLIDHYPLLQDHHIRSLSGTTRNRCCKLIFNKTLPRHGSFDTIELSFNSSWLLVGSGLFCLQNLPCLVGFRCMFRGRVEVWTKNFLYRFIEGQTNFSTTFWSSKFSDMSRGNNLMRLCNEFRGGILTRPGPVHFKFEPPTCLLSISLLCPQSIIAPDAISLPLHYATMRVPLSSAQGAAIILPHCSSWIHETNVARDIQL